jgi:serine/threonine-protein kinase
VDRRSDVFSLGLLLYQALTGVLPRPTPAVIECPRRYNADITQGLADILLKCLAHDPAQRYADAAGLSADLLRHVNDLPLSGVPNRSLGERWAKWRRRRPHALTIGVLAAAVLTATVGISLYALGAVNRHRHQAERSLEEGDQYFRDRAYGPAADSYGRGLALVQEVPYGQGLRQRLQGKERLSRRAQAVQNLHTLCDQLRFFYGATSLPRGRLGELSSHFREVWARRGELLDRQGTELAREVEQQLDTDLLDLGTLWADLGVRLADGPANPKACREALRVLDEVETLFGRSLVVDCLRQTYTSPKAGAESAWQAVLANPQTQPRSAWEYRSIGQALLLANQPAQAAKAFDQSLRLQPQSFWSNYYQGICAYRLKTYQQAVNSFRVCIALRPDCAACYFNRGLAAEALKDDAQALDDYSRALQIEPSLGSAALNRGLLHFKARRHQQALDDLRQAQAGGADPAVVGYNLALVYLERREPEAARQSLIRAVQANPNHPDAQALLTRLQQDCKPGSR